MSRMNKRPERGEEWGGGSAHERRFGPGFGPEGPRRGAGRGREGGPGHGHGFGGPGFGGFGPGFGPGGPAWWGPGGPRGRRGGRGRPRGDVRAAVLLLLEEGPRHGYQLIQDIAERSEGAWTPSAGSIYPTLSALEDEGLISIETVEGRKTASLTEAGGTYVNENREALGTPWSIGSEEGRDERRELGEAIGGLMQAVQAVMSTGTPAQREAAVATLTDARSTIYRTLAEG